MHRPYSRWLFPTYPELLRCQIQSGQSELVSLTNFLPRDIFPCAVCVQTIKGHLTVNSTIKITNIVCHRYVKDVCKSICNTRVHYNHSLDYQKRKETGDQYGSKCMNHMPSC